MSDLSGKRSGRTLSAPPTRTAKAPIARVTGPSHLAVEVSDLEQSITFYVDVFGLEIFHDERSAGNPPNVKGVVGGFGVELAQAVDKTTPAARRRAGSPTGSPVFSFAVANIDEAFEVLNALGIVEAPAPNNVRGVKFFFVFDPDGQAIELIEFPAPIRALADLRHQRDQR